jgi:hypothetical protein
MSHNVIAPLHTPWDCRWSRFGRMTGKSRPPEGLWVCVYTSARVPIVESTCEACPYWDYLPPLQAVLERRRTDVGTNLPATEHSASV